MGGVGGGTASALSPDEIKRNFINKCLAGKGYEVLGWD
jgi:outer membrane lipoprotein SlyB